MKIPASPTALNRSIKVMIEQLRKTANHWVVALGMMVLVAVLSGCRSAPPQFAETSQLAGTAQNAVKPVEEAGNTFHVGDLITVVVVPPNGDKLIPDHTERVGEDGNINLLYIGSIHALGKTAAELQEEIRTNYVPRLYKDLNVTVHGEARYFYVDREVRLPGKYEYNGSMSVVRAISVAGGFTDFAKRTKVQLTHNGKTQIINVDKAIKNPSLDLPVYPGDTIYVPRRIF
jgi:protein involved in polysaccharide export with SLBB domain